MTDSRQSLYLTWHSERQAVESSRGGRVSLHCVSVHLKDIGKPEVLLHRQPKTRDKQTEEVVVKVTQNKQTTTLYDCLNMTTF